MAPQAEPDRGAVARAQLRIGGGLLLLLALVALGLSLLAKNDSLHAFLSDEQQRMDRKRKTRFSYEHYFIDYEDRLINEEVPSANYSRGGVYLMGTSNLKWATRFWELPERQRALIHNYGIGATSHQFQAHFLRFLVEHEGLLAAGGEKTMIIFGLSWHALGPEFSPLEFFPSLWERHGLYQYDVNRGIIPQPYQPWARAIRFERVRIIGFLRSAASVLARRSGYRSKVRTLEPESYVRDRLPWFGPQWEARMKTQVGIFEEMARYLKARGVKTVVVLLPQGTWEERLPFKRPYDAAVKSVCVRLEIELHDWSGLLDDEDFADSNHPNPSGVDKLNPKFLEIALPFLRSTGALLPTE